MELLGAKRFGEVDLAALYDQGETNLCHSFGTVRELRQLFITQVLATNNTNFNLFSVFWFQKFISKNYCLI